MKKLNQKGFGAAETIILVVVLVLLGFVGFTFYKNQQNKPTQQENTQQTNEEDKQKAKEKLKFDTTVLDVEVELRTEEDLKKLPSLTPASFIEFMRPKLKKSDAASNGSCVETYGINKVSQVNIRGGGSSYTKGSVDDEVCVGGAPNIWALSKNGEWKYITLNGPLCTGEDDAKIYEEFLPECFLTQDTSDKIKNPNGSIKQLAEE